MAINFLTSSLHELANLLKQRDSSKMIVAFDEPDSKIHPVYLEPILNQIISFNIISIVTTTNEFTLDYYIKNNCNISLTHRTYETNQQVSIIEQFFLSESTSIMPEQIYSSPIFPSISSPKKVLIVEGKLEKQFFEALIHDKLKIHDVEIISIDGQDKVLSEEELSPFLHVLGAMSEENYLIYAIFDFDLDGLDYAKQFSQILNKDQIYFFNRKMLAHYINLYDESLEELQALFNTNAISTYVLEDYLKNSIKTPRIRKHPKSAKVLYELQETLSFKLKRYHLTEEKLTTVLNEFREWLPQQINMETELYKNVQQRKFSPLFDAKKINESNIKLSEYTSLKKLIIQIFGTAPNKFTHELFKCQRSSVQIKELQKLKEKLNIPDYVIKINRTTIEYLPHYNFYEFNNCSNDGLLSKDLEDLLEIIKN